MARFIVQNRVTSVDGLKDFDLGGYRFEPEKSVEGTSPSHAPILILPAA